MSFESIIDGTADKPQVYEQLREMASSMMTGESDLVANAANLSALVFASLPDLNWAGFYFLRGDELVVGPFQGLPACVRIPLGKGVCGTAAAQRLTQVVADVDQFPGHIACDTASRSELVVPIVVGDRLLGVFDVDSPRPDRFDEQDREGMEALVTAFIEAIKA